MREPEPGPDRAVVEAEADRQRRQRDRERDRGKEPRQDERPIEPAVDVPPARRGPGRRERDDQRRGHGERSDEHAEAEASLDLDRLPERAHVLERERAGQPRRRPGEALALGREGLLEHEPERQEVGRRDRQHDEEREPPHGAVPRRSNGSVSATLRSASRLEAAAAAPSFP